MRIVGPGGTRGQMSIELAVLIPVIVVVALVAFNLSRFVCACATFDRVARGAVVSQGVSPSGSQTTLSAVSQVQDAIVEAMGPSDVVRVEVRANSVGRSSHGGLLSLAPALTKYTCTLFYRPWPSSFVIAGVAFEPPIALVHERSLVVDRYKPGVVV